ncbi:MAG: hypothetical protein MUC29_10990 [Pyrinomonadaceae bacterium]|jgi:hypothetical protein|nr:hypothetical protein [Pyrinomonadaceae bacterium]
MKIKSKVLLFFVLVISSCTNADKVENTFKQKENITKEKRDELAVAIDDFIAKSYKSWLIVGLAENYAVTCATQSPCFIKIKNAFKEKTIVVSVKKVSKSNGEIKWQIQDVVPID